MYIVYLWEEVTRLSISADSGLFGRYRNRRSLATSAQNLPFFSTIYIFFSSI